MQRPLWASTSTKNPAYRDVIYVEELIGPDTVNTVPQNTLTALLDHAGSGADAGDGGWMRRGRSSIGWRGWAST